MLMLLKPWHDLRYDLKRENESWTNAFDDFLSTASSRIRGLLSGVQYYHDCDTSAKASAENDEEVNEDIFTNTRTQVDEDLEGIDPNEDRVDSFEINENIIQNLMETQIPEREQIHGKLALEVAKHAKIFPSNDSNWSISSFDKPRNALGGDVVVLSNWLNQLKNDVTSQNSNDNTISNPSDGSTDARVDTLTDTQALNDNEESIEPSISALPAEAPLPSVEPSLLKPDQFRAYSTIVWHLRQTLAGNNPAPLRMIIYGEGGTGKSKVIQTVTDAFVREGTIKKV
jgi:hypothetical protein